MLAFRSLLLLTATAAALGATPLTAQRPGPSNVTVTELKGGANISWRGIRDNSISYRVLRGSDPRKPGQDFTKPLPYDVTSVSDPSVPAGTTVYYTVVAVYGDGAEGASLPVPFTAAGSVAPMPTATPPRGAMTGAPLTMAPPMALRATAPVTAVGAYNQVTLSWPPVATQAPGAVTYVVRRVSIDPATLAPNAPMAYVTGSTVLAPDGRMTILDWNADLHSPTWYRIVASNAAQGSVTFPWFRRDPQPHRGVDTVTGSYWRVARQSGSRTITSWSGCAWASAVPGAAMYGARITFGPGSSFDIAMRPPASNPALLRLMWFDTANGGASLLQAFETGVTPLVRMWPVYSVGSSSNGPFVADTLHLQPMVYKFQQVTAPLTVTTCS